MQPINFPKPKLHFFVCTNDRTDIPNNFKPSCGPSLTSKHVKELKQWIRERGLTKDVYCAQAKCLGFCNPEGSVASMYHQSKFVKYQSIDELKEWIKKEFNTL